MGDPITSIKHALNGRQVVVIVGPTAIGKTALSLELAGALNADILSADSMQVYRLMDIGTAKVDAEWRRRIVHHGIDIRWPDESFSVAEFVEIATPLIHRAQCGGPPLIICGGTGMYIYALLNHFELSEVSIDPDLRLTLRARLAREGSVVLWNELARLDPGAAATIHPNHSSRIIRSLEIVSTTNGRLGDVQRRALHQRTDCVVVHLDAPREFIWRRIHDRVRRMITGGLIDEVTALLSQGYGAHLPSMQSIGYRETVAYLNGTLRDQNDYDEAIYIHTRQFSKRQMTWFKRIHGDLTIEVV